MRTIKSFFSWGICILLFPYYILLHIYSSKHIHQGLKHHLLVIGLAYLTIPVLGWTHLDKTIGRTCKSAAETPKLIMWRWLPQYWDKEQQHTWINSISSWDTSFLLYFWGKVFIISAVSGGPWCISQSGDLLPLECCEIEEVWDGSPADRRTSDTEI